MPLPTDLTVSEQNRLLRAAGITAGGELATELLEDLSAGAPLYAFDEATSRLLFLLLLKRDLFDLILGDYWRLFATQYGDEKESEDQKFTHLKALRDTCDEDIDKLRDRLAAGAAGGGYSHGDMVHTTPIQRDCFPNPGDRAYAGDPLRQTTPIDQDWFR